MCADEYLPLNKLTNGRLLFFTLKSSWNEIPQGVYPTPRYGGGGVLHYLPSLYTHFIFHHYPYLYLHILLDTILLLKVL
nr:MAG TPA: hypothetical protein [Caudoviricetes sp.]